MLGGLACPERHLIRGLVCMRIWCLFVLWCHWYRLFPCRFHLFFPPINMTFQELVAWEFKYLVARWFRLARVISFSVSFCFPPPMNMMLWGLGCMRIWLFNCRLVSLGACCFLVCFILFSAPINMTFQDWFAWEFRYLVVFWRHFARALYLSVSFYFFALINITFQEIVPFLSIYVQFQLCMSIDI